MRSFASISATRRRGAALLVLVIIAVIILGGLMSASHFMRQTTTRTIEHELNYHGQAVNAAKAGLVDALSWYRRQTAQPVATFAPLRDLAADPVINETDDPEIGLVREYQISTRDNLWGRYEVRIRVVQDITAEKNLPGTGRYWYAEAKGYVFERRDDLYTPTDFYYLYELSDGTAKRKRLDGSYETITTTPNGILEERYDEQMVTVFSSATIGSEFRRLSVIPPADAAICANRGDDIRLENRSRVAGHRSCGIIYPRRTGRHYKHSGAELTGRPRRARADPATYSLDEIDVFGVTPEELRSLADIYTDDPSTLPDELPDYSIVFVDSDVTWDITRPLKGTAILYVNGDVTLSGSSSSYFSGLMYITGTYTQYAPSLINGTIMCKDNITISGTGGDYSEVNFDKEVRNRILTISGQYRFSAPMYFAR